MNVITIYYDKYEHSKFFELMRTIHSAQIKLDWDNLNSTFKIMWDWHQKGEVIKLIPFFKETFLDASIKVENDIEENDGETEADLMNIEEVEENSIIEDEPDFDDFTYESDDIATDSDEFEQEIKDDEEMLDEVSEFEEDVDSISYDYEEEVNEDVCETETDDIEMDTNDESVELEFVEVEDIVSESCDTEDSDGSDDFEDEEVIPCDSSVVSTAEIEEEAEVVEEIPETVNEESFECAEEEVTYNSEEELSKVLTPYIEKYDFNGDFEKAVASFCKEQGIKSAPFVSMFTLANLAPNVNALYKSVFKIHSRMNSALVKAEINKTFKNFIKSTNPDILDKCPDVNVINFLNLFRSDDNKL